MKFAGVVVTMAIAFAPSLTAQEPDANLVTAALDDIRQELKGAPPSRCFARIDGWRCSDPANPKVMTDLPADAIVVAQRTIGGAPGSYRAFVQRWFGEVIAEELMQSYGHDGPRPRTIDAPTAAGFSVLPLEEFAAGSLEYDWPRLNQKYPAARWVARVSWPATDRLGTYAVVRYELIGRDRPFWGAFVKFEKQPDGSWKRGIGEVGTIWN